jgi:hypothetical protein
VVTVENQYTAGYLFRKLVFLTFLGFAVMVLFGPIVAIASVILPFALVGFLVWIPFQLFALRRPVDWDRIGVRARALGQDLANCGRGCTRVAAWPARLASGIVAAVVGTLAFLVRTAFSTVRILIQVALMLATGAAIGAVWGVISSSGVDHDRAPVIALNAIVGGVLAALTWAVMTVMERRTPVRSY